MPVLVGLAFATSEFDDQGDKTAQNTKQHYKHETDRHIGGFGNLIIREPAGRAGQDRIQRELVYHNKIRYVLRFPQVMIPLDFLTNQIP